MSAVGFDVGNETCYIAAVMSGGIEILDNECSLRGTPTYIAFTDTFRNIGVSAKANLITNIENTVFGFKKILGKKNNDMTAAEEQEYLPHDFVEVPNGDIGFKVNYLKNNTVFSTTQIMSMMLTKLRLISENKLKNRIGDCVIAVPAYYTEAQRRAMITAAKIVDLNPLRLMNEPVAVALSHGYYKHDLSTEHPQNVIFIDIGSSATTVSISSFTKGKLKVLGTVWDNVGGRNFDAVLVRHFTNEFKDRYKIDVMRNKKALMTLTLECESLKKQMSMNSLELGITIECFMNELDVNGRMKRSIFENLSAELLSRIEKTIQSILDRTKLTVGEIHSVEIVGGCTRIPAVKRLISIMFGRNPNCTLNQDEAVARGCALQCAILSPALKTRDFIIEDVPSYDIILMTENMESKEIDVFTGSDKLPTDKIIALCMCKPFTMIAFEVDRSTQKRNKIGSFAFGNFPPEIENKCSEVEVQVKARVDIHGLFSIGSARLVVRSKRVAIALPEKEEMTKTREDEPMDTNGVDSYAGEDVKTFELSVTADVLELSSKDLSELAKTEKHMINRDQKEKEKADARNALEEYIYDVRSKINDEFKEFVQDSDRNKLLQYLNEQESWLYDNEGQDAREFSRRVTESEKLFQPIFRRYREWEQRPKVVEEFQEALQKSLDQIEEVTAVDKINIQSEVENLKSILSNAVEFFNKFVSSFSSIKRHQDASVTTEYMRKWLSEFQSDFQKKFADLKNKMDESGEISGDTLKNNDENFTNIDQASLHE